MTLYDRVLRWLRSAAQVVLMLGVAALLWPASLGGQVHYVMVSGTSMEPHMHTGDLVLVREQSSYEIGDAVAYRIPAGETGEGSVVIHRITGGNAVDGFETQGDNRERADVWKPTGADVLGKRQLLVGGAGTVVAQMRNPVPLAVLAGTFVFLAVAWKPKASAVPEPA
jgi:signal peptidase I